MQESTLHIVLPLRGGGGGEPEMTVAAGGLINQSIIRDMSPIGTWDADRTVLFNVQIVNASLFPLITDLPAPTTPITAQSYADVDLPYFKIYDEQPSGISGDFADVKSVAQIDNSKTTDAAKLAAEEVNQATNNPIILLDKNGRRLLQESSIAVQLSNDEPRLPFRYARAAGQS